MGPCRVRHRRTGLALGAIALMAVGLGGSGTATATTADGVSFSASATADGGRMALFIPGASIADQIIDGGGPVAQADLDSLGSSGAFAATPYPGELGVIGPGIVASLVGAPQPPGYPFIAASRYPATPEQHVEYGQFYRLQANSGERSSEASARTSEFGGDIKMMATRASARVAADAGTVTALAGNRFEGVTAGPLQITSVDSSASVSQGSAAAEKSSSLVVTGASVNGQVIGFSDQGFVLGGDARPLPPSDPLMAALGQAGVTVTYLKAETTPSGIVAPGLRIVAVRDIPGAQRTATVALTLGRASATVETTGESTSPVELPTDNPGPTGDPTPESAIPMVSAAPAATAAPSFGVDPVLADPAAADFVAVVPNRGAGAALEVAAPAAADGGGVIAAPVASVAAPLAAAPRLVRNAWWAKKINTGATIYPFLLVAGGLFIGGLRAARMAGVKQ
jgi:hypothetical protein